jgi:hypothetical protein
MVEHNHENLMNLIDNLKHNIKAFNGDVYGNILTIDHKDILPCCIPQQSGNPSLSQSITMHCRIDVYLFSVFMQVLNLNFDVETFPIQFNEYIGLTKQFVVKPKNNAYTNEHAPKVILEVCYQATPEWSKLPCDFDVHLLAENASSVFLRSNYTCLDKFVDKIGHIQRRISLRKFTLLDATACKTVEKLRVLIDRAQGMIQRGWMMDDLLYGDQAWNINLWLSYQMRPKACRVFHDKKKLDSLLSLDECPLCNEHFKECDIVINTRCNHNFHWCNNRCKGLSEWLKRGNISCPVCRKNAL